MSEAAPNPPVPTPGPAPPLPGPQPGPSPPKPGPEPSPAPIPKGFDPTSGIIGVIGGIVLTVVVGAVALGWFAWSPGPPAPKPPLILTLVTDKPHVGRRIQIHADTVGKTVKWQVLSGPTTAENYDFWSEDGGTHDQDLTTPIPGNYRVQAITVVLGEPEAAEIMVPVDVGPGPGPVPPGPTPGPIPAGQLRVMLTYDATALGKMDPAQRDVLYSQPFLSQIGSGKWRIYKTNQTFGDELPIWKDVYGKRKNPVGIVIFNGQDGSIAYEGPLPANVADATSLIKKFGG